MPKKGSLLSVRCNRILPAPFSFGFIEWSIFVEFTTLLKCHIKGRDMLHFMGSLRQMTQKLDCAFDCTENSNGA